MLLPLFLSFCGIILCTSCLSAYQRNAIKEARADLAASRLQLAKTQVVGALSRFAQSKKNLHGSNWNRRSKAEPRLVGNEGRPSTAL